MVLVFAISIVSCKKDDDGDNTFLLNNTNVAGSYALTFFASTDVETTTINGLEIVSTTTTTGDTFQLDIIFDEDGSYLVDGEYRESFVVDVNGTVTMEDSEIIVIDNETGNYSTNSANSLFILDGTIYEVTLFNQTELRITSQEIITETNGDTFRYNEEMRFTRQ